MSGWVAQAACRYENTSTFFPDVKDDLAIALATTICYTCPVRRPCLDYARRLRLVDGIWGGVFLERPSRRRQLRRCSRCGSTHLFRWQGRFECSECKFSWAG